MSTRAIQPLARMTVEQRIDYLYRLEAHAAAERGANYRDRQRKYGPTRSYKRRKQTSWKSHALLVGVLLVLALAAVLV